MSLDKFTAEVRERLDAATPGKWSAHERNPQSIAREYEIRVHSGTLFRSTSYGRMAEDATLIAHAPQDLARCLAIIEVCVQALEAVVKKVPEKVDQLEAADMAVEFKMACREALNKADKIVGGD